MMKIKKTFFLLFVLFFINACVTPEYQKQESIFVVFKTPSFKHADLGFVYKNDHAMKIEIYSNGQAIMALNITEEMICMSLLECLGKKEFNERVLSRYYPPEILNNIFRAQPIYEGLNFVKVRNGFTQKFSKVDQYAIDYSVLNSDILFRDKMNDILIKIKRLK